MDVAWSLPQSYIVDNELESLVDNSNTSWPREVGNIAGSVTPHDSYEELISQPDFEHHSSSRHEHHYPSFIRRRFMSGGEHSAISPYLDDTSVIAAAGSNGVIVAWNASSFLSAPLLSNSSGGGLNPRKNMGSTQQVSSGTFGQPEASFFAHSRAVNRLAWHPTGRRPYLLLTASQDGSVKLWDRRATSSLSVHPGSVNSVGSNASVAHPMFKLNAQSWFGFGNSSAVQSAQLSSSIKMPRTATWHCISTYQPKLGTSEAVRDISWNPAIDDSKLPHRFSMSPIETTSSIVHRVPAKYCYFRIQVFAFVAGEWLCVYDIRINRPMLKESTHAGDATCIDWHPTRKYVIATGGGRDRSVKGLFVRLIF
jgi:WD40 repeat protein